MQVTTGEPASPAVQAARTASFAANDIGGGTSSFARPSGAAEVRTPRALEVETSGYSAPVPGSALRSRSIAAYLPGLPVAPDRLPSGPVLMHISEGGQSAGHAAGWEGSEGGVRMPATPPTTPFSAAHVVGSS